MTNTTHRTSGLWLFFILTYALMLLTWGIMVSFQIPGASTSPGAPASPPGALVLLLLGGSTPSIAGLLVTWRVDGRAGLQDLWKRATKFALGWKAYLVIGLFPILGFGLRAAFYVLRGGILAQSALLAQPLSLLAFTLQIFLLGPVFEEFGWRGFALDRLLSKWNALMASLILGGIWAFWHLPLFFISNTAQHNYGNPLPEFLTFALTVIGSTVLYTWLYLGTNRSLWSAILFHFTSNFSLSFLATFVDDGFIGRLMWAGVYVVLAIAIGFGWKKGMLDGNA